MNLPLPSINEMRDSIKTRVLILTDEKESTENAVKALLMKDAWRLKQERLLRHHCETMKNKNKNKFENICFKLGLSIKEV